MALYAANGGKAIFEQFLTPIGTAVHMYHDKPLLKVNETSKQPILDKDGIQEAEFKVTMTWPKAFMNSELMPMRQLAAKVRDQAWGATAANDQWFVLQPFLRDGDNPEHNTKKREYLFGNVYLNFKQRAIPCKTPNGIIYEGGPQIIGPANEDMLGVDVYAGCKVRVSGIMFGTEYSGKNFISVRLNNIQKADYEQHERIGGGSRPDAKSQFDPLIAGGNGGLGGLGSLGSLGGNRSVI